MIALNGWIRSILTRKFIYGYLSMSGDHFKMTWKRSLNTITVLERGDLDLQSTFTLSRFYNFMQYCRCALKSLNAFLLDSEAQFLISLFQIEAKTMTKTILTHHNFFEDNYFTTHKVFNLSIHTDYCIQQKLEDQITFSWPLACAYFETPPYFVAS